MPKPQLEPMLFRKGAAYTCFGDGLCCTDIHGLGPITKRELIQIRRIDPRGADHSEAFEDFMLRTAADGGCHFLMPDMLCRVHAEHGADQKPEGCIRFPLGLVATPSGGRVTTEHRCPCRTMGERPPLTEDAVTDSLRGDDGDVFSDRDVRKIRLAKKEKISFEEWEAIEGPMIERLINGERAADVLDAKPFPPLKSSWEAEAEELMDGRDGTQFGILLAWVADSIFALEMGQPPRTPARPWAHAFDRAEARDGKERTPDQVFGDYIADEIWSLKWTEEVSFDVARLDLVTRDAIARECARRIEATGTSKGRAAAEAVMIVSVVCDSDHWEEVVDHIIRPAPADR